MFAHIARIHKCLNMFFFSRKFCFCLGVGHDTAHRTGKFQIKWHRWHLIVEILEYVLILNWKRVWLKMKLKICLKCDALKIWWDFTVQLLFYFDKYNERKGTIDACHIQFQFQQNSARFHSPVHSQSNSIYIHSGDWSTPTLN